MRNKKLRYVTPIFTFTFMQDIFPHKKKFSLNKNDQKKTLYSHSTYRVLYVDEWSTETLTIPSGESCFIIDTSSQAKYSLNIYGECHLLKLCLWKETSHTLCAEVESKSIFTVDAIILSDNTELTIFSSIVWNDAHARINILALAKNNANIELSGNISVHKSIQGYSAYVRQKSILLWNVAHIRGVPTLMIGSKDGEAWHSCTIGRVSDTDIFYLESHGIDRKISTKLITQGLIEKRLQCFVWLPEYDSLRATLLQAL